MYTGLYSFCFVNMAKMTSTSPTLPSWRELSRCTLCHDAMFYPLFFACRQHAACFRCIHNRIQHSKMVIVDLTQPTGVHDEAYGDACPVCGVCIPTSDDLSVVLSKLTIPPVDWIKKFHALRTDASSAMCPFCFEFVLHEIEDGYSHLRTCAKRPMLCKMCNQHIHTDKYSEHLRKQCSEFRCSEERCRDGKQRGMKLDTIRAHTMSHEQYKTAKKQVIDDFVKMIESIPHSTEEHRLNFSKLSAAGLAIFAQTVKKLGFGLARDSHFT
jgi:hypothetical protein